MWYSAHWNVLRLKRVQSFLITGTLNELVYVTLIDLTKRDRSMTKLLKQLTASIGGDE